MGGYLHYAIQLTTNVMLGLNSMWGWQQDNLVRRTKEFIEPKRRTAAQ